MLENDMISCKNGQKKFGITRRCNPPPTGLAHFWGKVIPPLVTPCPSRESNPRPWLRDPSTELLVSTTFGTGQFFTRRRKCDYR